MHTALNKRNAVSPYPSLQLRYDFCVELQPTRKAPKVIKRKTIGVKSLSFRVTFRPECFRNLVLLKEMIKVELPP